MQDKLHRCLQRLQALNGEYEIGQNMRVELETKHANFRNLGALGHFQRL